MGKGKGSPYLITERRVPELITVLGSQPAGDVSHKPGHYFPRGLQKGPGSNRSRSLCSPSSEIDSSPLKGCRVTAGLAESNGSLPPGL